MSASANQQEQTRLIELTRSVRAEIGRCIIHIETGLFDARREILHARLLQLLPTMIVEDDAECSSIAIELRSEGATLLINPHYFLTTLESTAERAAALRHAEQHLFLLHPIRAFEHGAAQFTYDARLFAVCAELEAGQSVSGHTPLLGIPNERDYQTLGIHSRMTAESLFLELSPIWSEAIKAYNLSPEAPDLSEVSEPMRAQTLLELAQRRCPCDRRLWIKPRGREGGLSVFQVARLKTDLERLLLTARESLKVEELSTVPKAELERAQRVSRDHHLSLATAPLEEVAELFEETRREVEAIIVQMQIKDTFFGRYLSSCVRQVTTALPTAGVGIYQDYYALLINPYFFMNQLKSRAERGAVLKHEALHIMLKHVIQINDSKIKDKRLYNIAADLEVNQYIGEPWSLPSDAMTLKKISWLNLPPNDVAETYYDLLMKSSDRVHQELSSGPHSSNESRSSDHRGWLSEAVADAGADSMGRGNISTPLEVSDEALSHHELEIESQVKRAVDSISSKGRGTIPGRVFALLDEWAEARAPQIDWRRQLRLFITTHPSYSRSHTHRKVNRRYVRLVRRALSVHRLTADALLLIARRDASLLPPLRWGELDQELCTEALRMRPKLTHLTHRDPLPWLELPRLIVHQIYTRFSELSWPSWGDLSDAEVSRLGLLREPLQRDSLPSDLLVVLSREYPKLLAPISWETLGPVERARLEARYEHLRRVRALTWSSLPPDEIAKLTVTRPELFPITWRDVPPQLIAQMPYYQISGDEVFRVTRVLKKTLPGLTREKAKPTILTIIDTSGSVTDDEIMSLFDEIDGMAQECPKVYVLQVDSEIQLFYEYKGQRPVSGRGGTDFEIALKWLNEARHGVETPVLVNHQVIRRHVQLRVDGVIYLTDGEAQCPVSAPYCRLMWVLTPYSTDKWIKDWEHTSKVITLPRRD